MSKSLGIIGYPLGHSISPVFQQAALDALGIDARYEGWETAPEDLEKRLESFRSDGVLGYECDHPTQRVGDAAAGRGERYGEEDRQREYYSIARGQVDGAQH